MSFLIQSIERILNKVNNKPRIFLVDENVNGLERGMEMVKSMNVKTDGFIDCKKLLYTLQSHKKRKYCLGIIRENGSKYKPQILSNFIKNIDPTIQLIVYKDENNLVTENITSNNI